MVRAAGSELNAVRIAMYGRVQGGKRRESRSSRGSQDGESQAEEFPFREQLARENRPTGNHRGWPRGEPLVTGSEDGIPGERCRTKVLQDCSGAWVGFFLGGGGSRVYLLNKGKKGLMPPGAGGVADEILLREMLKSHRGSEVGL